MRIRLPKKEFQRWLDEHADQVREDIARLDRSAAESRAKAMGIVVTNCSRGVGAECGS